MRILYVEDNPFDADLTRREMRRLAPAMQIEVVDTLAAARARLEATPMPYTAVLLDLRLPDGDGLSLLNTIRQAQLHVVVIILTGAGDEETAVSALKAGADDYIVKQGGYLGHLPNTIESAVQRFEVGQRMRSRRLRVLYAESHIQDIDITTRHLARHAPYIQLEIVSPGIELQQRLKDPRYDVLLLDYSVGGLNALDVVKQVAEAGLRALPLVLVATQGNEEVALQALKLGAADYLVKGPGYLYRLPSVLENAFHMAELERERRGLAEREQRISEAYENTIEGWARALELREHESEGHSIHVANLAVSLAEAMGLRGEDLTYVRRGALLHDVGKLGVPESVLQNPGTLSEDEWAQMRMHPTYAYQILYPIEFLRPAIDIPYGHHERWDGTGYPHGLKGEEIPLLARLFAVVDVWEALNTDRPYRPAWDRTRIERFLRDQAGVKFDPQVVQIFLEKVVA